MLRKESDVVKIIIEVDYSIAWHILASTIGHLMIDIPSEEKERIKASQQIILECKAALLNFESREEIKDKVDFIINYAKENSSDERLEQFKETIINFFEK